MPLVKFAGCRIASQELIDQFSSAGQVTLNALRDQHGFPLYGLFVAPDGGILPDFILHVANFPAQTGSPAQRPEKLQLALDVLLQDFYASADYGAKGRPFFTNTHVWNYQNDPLNYRPRAGGVGDFLLYTSDNQPPGNWWQDIQ